MPDIRIRIPLQAFTNLFELSQNDWTMYIFNREKIKEAFVVLGFHLLPEINTGVSSYQHINVILSSW